MKQEITYIYLIYTYTLPYVLPLTTSVFLFLPVSFTGYSKISGFIVTTNHFIWRILFHTWLLQLKVSSAGPKRGFEGVSITHSYFHVAESPSVTLNLHPTGWLWFQHKKWWAVFEGLCHKDGGIFYGSSAVISLIHLTKFTISDRYRQIWKEETKGVSLMINTSC